MNLENKLWLSLTFISLALSCHATLFVKKVRNKCDKKVNSYYTHMYFYPLIMRYLLNF